MKPVNIALQIGKRPVFAAGNVGGKGDIAMLSYSQARRGPSFQLLVNHDDAERESAYAENDGASLRAASERGWTVVSMKRDWSRVFPAPGTAGSQVPAQTPALAQARSGRLHPGRSHSRHKNTSGIQDSKQERRSRWRW
ncbi:hypothetical protein AWV80_27330 [Cupriavidus sp. UYMU48A]|nr:hypothetical protein AWV80_27330 [Cupriavidus sp. UYMU48A]